MLPLVLMIRVVMRRINTVEYVENSRLCQAVSPTDIHHLHDVRPLHNPLFRVHQ